MPKLSSTLTIRPNGSVTLPKEWRDQYPTRHFIAELTPDGLLIKPILKTEYYEQADGSFGLRFPYGMDMEEFEQEIEKSLKKPSKRASHG